MIDKPENFNEKNAVDRVVIYRNIGIFRIAWS